jgi:hypothetical protein
VIKSTSDIVVLQIVRVLISDDKTAFWNCVRRMSNTNVSRIRLFGVSDALAGFPSYHLKHVESPIQPFRKKIVQSQFFWELSPDKIHRRQKGTVEVSRRSAELIHCRTQSVLGRIVPQPSHLTRPLRRVQLTKTSQKLAADRQCEAGKKETDDLLKRVILQKTRLQDLILIIKSTYQG